MSKGQTAKKKTDSGNKPRKPNSGQFKKGNTIGIETRFDKGNAITSVYDPTFPDSMLEYAKRDDVAYPSLEGWCLEHGIIIRTAQNWVANHIEYPRFSSAYEELKEIQKHRLAERGLLNRYNPQIVKFLLENNHGMREKADNSVTYTVKFSEEIDEESN